MIVSWNWLKEYFNLDVSSDDLAERLRDEIGRIIISHKDNGPYPGTEYMAWEIEQANNILTALNLPALLAEERAEERERCAKIAEETFLGSHWNIGVRAIAAVIRARSDHQPETAADD